VNIGLLIRDLRDAKGLSRKAMAADPKADISYWGLENLETGASNPRMSTVLKLLDYLDAGLVLMQKDGSPETFVVTLD